MTDPRLVLTRRLMEDLLGPEDPEEVLSDRPSDRYLTGILSAQKQEIGAEEDDRLDIAAAGEDDDAADGVAEEVPTSFMRKPSAAGLSFRCETDTGPPKLSVLVTGGTYRREENESGDDREGDDPAVPEDERRHKRRFHWRRTAEHLRFEPEIKIAGSRDHPLNTYGLAGFFLHVTCSQLEKDWLVTVVLVNTNRVTKDGPRPDELALFQAGLEVTPLESTRIVARPQFVSGDDDDGAVSELLYRDTREYAVGHTCGARWEEAVGGGAVLVATTWMPEQRVLLVATEGARQLRDALEGRTPDPLAAETLADAETDLVTTLEPLIAGYEQWIADERKRIPTLPQSLQERGRLNLVDCATAARRMRTGLAELNRDPDVRAAFRLMNRAMTVQRRWVRGQSLRWRPFQLGFILESLVSLANPESPEREVMDLLWFPTGGGKTEAYLGMIAFSLFLRRLRRRDELDRGGGTSCIMRYTLRLLTLQQFQRAAALTLACEYLRRGHELPDKGIALSETAPISIGLWVGGTATANTFAIAAEALVNPYSVNSPRQLTTCPACKQALRWTAIEQEERLEVRCMNQECELARAIPDLPVYTVDTDVYRERPTLLIGTIDKFAQIVRSAATVSIFNLGHAPPPDLIIQDELHLIAGPLGTLAAVYETAIDLICARDGYRPKIIGSTATIRRARDQVRALFNRSVSQFPPAGLDATDSCFAVVPTDARDRLYLGLTTAGRSAKFTLQAVFASLLQGSTAIPALAQRDGYHTLVAYFNSLRELGGALVLVQDDVVSSTRMIARRRNEQFRESREIVELTSRVSQREIRDILDRLELQLPSDSAVDAVLATNMVSVGVDVSRLALMVVLGQPKSISEYIQATSRVGRETNPGLIVTILNNAKTRDRSRYETFSGWHSALYRGVEATSVTPFASRSRDRALHAALVAVARHLVPALKDSPRANSSAFEAMRRLADEILSRVNDIDAEERDQTEAELEEILEDWRNRSVGLDAYWNDYKPRSSLLISAEVAAARQRLRAPGEPWPTLNSMRTVEAGTPFRLIEGLRGPQNAGT